eukprot:1146614-Pelagomonas_calceolata.AAC.3
MACILAGDVVRAPCGVMHGKTSPVFHTNVGVLEGLPNTREHKVMLLMIPEVLKDTPGQIPGNIIRPTCAFGQHNAAPAAGTRHSQKRGTFVAPRITMTGKSLTSAQKA